MKDVLEKILEARRISVEKSKSVVSLEELDRRIAKLSPPLNFRGALSRSDQRLAIIAEMKKQSPSAGVIREDYIVSRIAGAYKRGGADALSVLTEGDFFGGEVLDLQRAKDAAQLPILRKDFIFEPYQIAEARAYGADAVLLIADMLAPSHLTDLVACARVYKLETLVEVFSESVVEAALQSGSTLIGINTRNLRTLEMIPDNVMRLTRLIPKDRVVVAESGIKGPSDLKALKTHRVNAVLVGESLLKQDDLEKAVRTMREAT